MAPEIPDYEKIMLPLLKFASDGQEHSIREAIEHVSDVFKLSDEDKGRLLPSGQQPVIDNRVGWARTYLKKAGLFESPRRAYFRITSEGLDVVKKNPSEIGVKYLEQFPKFNEFKTINNPALKGGVFLS